MLRIQEAQVYQRTFILVYAEPRGSAYCYPTTAPMPEQGASVGGCSIYYFSIMRIRSKYINLVSRGLSELMFL